MMVVERVYSFGTDQQATGVELGIVSELRFRNEVDSLKIRARESSVSAK